MARWLVARFPGGEMTGNRNKLFSSIKFTAADYHVSILFDLKLNLVLI